MILALALLYVLPLLLVPSEGLDAENRLKAENDFRTVLVQAVGGSILLIGTARTLHINREGQITERFTRAIEHLGQSGDDKLDVRLGGIYALERIGRDSKSDRGPIVEVLSAFLREHARWDPDADHAAEDVNSNPRPGSPELRRLRADLQAVATVLARSGWSRMHQFDLGCVDLHHAHLVGAHLEGANLVGAHLERADLAGAHLEGADLRDAHLERADLVGAHLEGADLRDAHLERADLVGAHLGGAYLVGAHLEGAYLGGAHLGGAYLRDAHLEGAYLRRAHLEGANLDGAHLEGALGLDEEDEVPRSSPPEG